MYKLDLKKEKHSLIVFLLILLAAFYFLMRPFFYSLILAGIITALTYPLYDRLNRFFKNRRRLSALAMTFGLFFLFLLPSILVGSVLIDQIYDLVSTLNLQETFSDVFSHESYQKYITPWVLELETRFNIKIDLLALLTQAGKKAAGYFYRFSPKVLLGTFGFIFDFFIMIVTVYFLYLEGPKLFQVIMDLSPMRKTHELRLARKFTETIQATVYGYLVTSFVQGVLATVAFVVTGLKGSVVLGTLVFFMSMVPVIGATGVWLPVALWLFFKGEMGWGIFNVAYGALIISGIDNFLKPMIIQGKIKIHPLLIFFSLFGGIAFFGPLGILFGPVITALLIATIQIYRTEFLS